MTAVNPHRTEALRLCSMGLNAIPIKGKKAVIQWKEYQKARLRIAEIERMPWEEADGIGLILGLVSNVYAVDFDEVIDPSIVSDWLIALRLPEDYPWVEKTGAGYQLLFRCGDEIKKVT